MILGFDSGDGWAICLRDLRIEMAQIQATMLRIMRERSSSAIRIVIKTPAHSASSNNWASCLKKCAIFDSPYVFFIIAQDR